MGMSSDAHLIYGYDFGGANGWKIQNVSKHDELTLDWCQDDGYFASEATDRLIAAAGFTETRPDAPSGDQAVRAWCRRKHEAEYALTVQLYSYGHHDYPSHILGTRKISAGEWAARTVDLVTLARHPDRDQWDSALAAALTALGINPTQDGPSWVLCSSYT